MDNAKAIAGQQLPCSSQFDPMKNPKTEYMLRLHQLTIIADRLLELYAEDFSRLEDVKSAHQKLSEGQIDGASIELQKLIFEFDIDETKQKQLKNIMKESIKFAEKTLEDMQADPKGTTSKALFTLPKSLESRIEKEQVSGY